MKGGLHEEMASSAEVGIKTTSGRKVPETVEAGRHNTVQYRKREWISKPWMKKWINLARRLPKSLQPLIIRRLQKHGTYKEWEVLEVTTNLLTNNGRDLLHNAGLQATGQPPGGEFIAISADAGNPVAGDTTLTGEITTPAGLARADSAYSHTGGTNTSTLVHTFTNDGAMAETAIRRSATFNASSAGTIGFSNTFTNVDLQINDQLEVTWTITIG